MTAESEATVEIVRLGALGDGVGEGSRGPIFVAGALPGERVRAAVAGERGHVIEMLQTSPERARPICPHFAQCGGCVAQHMSERLQRGWKLQTVVVALQHRGLAPPVMDTLSVGPHSRRRTVLTARRSEGGSLALGYSAEGSHELVAIESCPVLVPEIERVLPALGRIAVHAISGIGDARMTVLAAREGLDVAVEGPRPVTEPARRALLAREATSAGVVRLLVGGEPILMACPPIVDLGGVAVAIPAGGFVQASAAAEQAMRAIVVDAVGRAKRVADLFAGAGAFSFALARRAEVLAVDSDAALIGALAHAARHTPGLKPIKTLVRDLFREPLSRRELDAFEAVVIDPPRAGAKTQSEAIARSKVPVIVAVSCNPATLARDLRVLVDGGYEIERVVPVDQFVFAAHVEAVAVLRRAKRA